MKIKLISIFTSVGIWFFRGWKNPCILLKHKVIAFEERNPNFVLFPYASHAETFEHFWCPDCKLAAPIAFFRGLLPPETLERVSIVFDYY